MCSMMIILIRFATSGVRIGVGSRFQFTIMRVARVTLAKVNLPPESGTSKSMSYSLARYQQNPALKIYSSLFELLR